MSMALVAGLSSNLAIKLPLPNTISSSRLSVRLQNQVPFSHSLVKIQFRHNPKKYFNRFLISRKLENFPVSAGDAVDGALNDERGESTMPERFRYLSKEAPDPPLRWPFFVASESGDFTILCQVFKDCLVSCKGLSSASYMNLAKACTKTEDIVQLLEFVKEIIEMTFPSLTVINKIIYGFSQCREIDKALQIFNQMKLLSCKPDLYTYNIILDMLGRAGRIDETLPMFVSMKEDGIAPDIVSYNTLINGWKKVGRLDLCLIYFREMVEIGIEPDLLTYTALIESFGRSGNIEESLRLLREMKLKNVRPSKYIYRSLISSSKKIGKVGLAMDLLNEMKLNDSLLAGPRDFKRRKG